MKKARFFDQCVGKRHRLRLGGFELAEGDCRGRYIFYGLDRILHPKIERATGGPQTSRLTW